MSAADLAGYVLETLMSSKYKPDWNRHNFCGAAMTEYAESRAEAEDEVAAAVSTAWGWLEVNGLICRNPKLDSDWYMPTARGRDVQNHQAVRALISAEQLPETFLHPELLVHARPLFLQSRFETAIFEAFKALEIAIRSAAGLSDGDIGIQLAQAAFHPQNGQLTDTSAEAGERVALMHLMVGALGSY